MHQKVLFTHKLWPTPLPTNIVTPNRLYTSLPAPMYICAHCLFNMLFLSIISTAYHLLSGSRAARLLLNWLIDWLRNGVQLVKHFTISRQSIFFGDLHGIQLNFEWSAFIVLKLSVMFNFCDHFVSALLVTGKFFAAWYESVTFNIFCDFTSNIGVVFSHNWYHLFCYDKSFNS